MIRHAFAFFIKDYYYPRLHELYIIVNSVCVPVSCLPASGCLQCRLLASPIGFHLYGNYTLALDDIHSAVLLLLQHIEYAAGDIGGALFTQAIQNLVCLIAGLGKYDLFREVGKHVGHRGAWTDGGKLNARTLIELLVLWSRWINAGINGWIVCVYLRPDNE